MPPLVAVVGPTGIGKTAVAIELAQRLNGEIVGADSRQVYREMEIGTAKPTRAEQAAVPHRLIDVVAPNEPFSLAMYYDAATDAIADITRRGKLPLLVGGTGQYLQAVLEGWQIPRVAPNWARRAAWEAQAATEGVATLYAHLALIDPLAAQGIMPNNLRRIIRALEVYAVTGRPISERQTKVPPPYRITTLWLDVERDQLYPRLDARVERMMGLGLLQEVTSLVERGYDWSLPAMSSLGYREWQPYFMGEATVAACVERLKFNTHNFVRKQTSWFKRLPKLQRISAEGDVLWKALAAYHT
ncbi:MAG: tRNA (adenosine(37)-N6)-dimethylallyltransferase MiaA [Herpetosiphonaceae bacterium]|nr:tRNA (adenosine(37)-N6)-dimethylallyltransferase MiaA [Herpetosiphonaceae bacterium]